jgi:hypothetical protein
MKKLVLLAAVLAVPAASAQPARPPLPVQQVLQEFGLIGEWANACNLPADLDQGNSRAIYALSKSAGVILTYENGPKYKPSVYAILTARRTAKDRVTYVQERLADRTRVTVTLLKKENSISVWSSALDNGTELVKDGRYVANGRENPPQLRCGS